MNKEIEIPEGYEARIEGNKVILEPKESEDERIRREIIYLLSYIDITEDNRKRWITYLEKQKEQKSIEDVVKKITQSKETATKFLKSAGIMNENGELAEMYRSEEQKPVEYPEKGNEYWFGFNEGKGTVLDNPEQFGLYRPAEWSEKDKKIIGRLRSVVNECAFKNDALDVNGDYCEGGYAKLDAWLKSLRPQPHWKPSDEQMEALARATNRCVGVDDAKILIKLLEQLEKL